MAKILAAEGLPPCFNALRQARQKLSRWRNPGYHRRLMAQLSLNLRDRQTSIGSLHLGERIAFASITE